MFALFLRSLVNSGCFRSPGFLGLFGWFRFSGFTRRFRFWRFDGRRRRSGRLRRRGRRCRAGKRLYWSGRWTQQNWASDWTWRHCRVGSFRHFCFFLLGFELPQKFNLLLKDFHLKGYKWFVSLSRSFTMMRLAYFSSKYNILSSGSQNLW